MNTNTWKNQTVFEKQLSLNLKELELYPQHWIDFINLISTQKISTILDIGCGCGIYYHLCKIHFPEIIYTGIDYSVDAIKLAKKQWKYDKFFECDFWSLTHNYVSLFDMVHCGALFDVLPNADSAIEHLLKLSPKKIIIGRIKFTNKNSYYEEYLAYDLIPTYAYYHNDQILNKLFAKYNYSVSIINNTLLLNKNNSNE